MKRYFKRKPTAARLENQCRNCHTPMKKVYFFKRFHSALCKDCNKKYKKYIKIFDKLHDKFTDSCFSKKGEVFYNFLQNKKPVDVRVDLRIEYREDV